MHVSEIGHTDSGRRKVNAKCLCIGQNTDPNLMFHNLQPCITSLPHNPDLTTLRKRLLKTFWEREKMLVTSISQNVFYPFRNKFQFFSHIFLGVCKSFLQPKVLMFGKELKQWLKELQESMDRCSSFPDITEIMLQMVLKTLKLAK